MVFLYILNTRITINSCVGGLVLEVFSVLISDLGNQRDKKRYVLYIY